VIALLAIAALATYPRLQWLDDLEKLSGSSLQQLKQIDQSIRAQISTIEAGRVVLIEAKTLEIALQKSEQVTLILQQLQHTGSINDFYPLYPWLVSQQLQQRNLDVYQQQISPLYQQHWQTALATQGLSVSKLGNLKLAEAGRLDAEQVLQSQVKQLIAAQVIQKNDRTALVIWLGPHTPHMVADAMQSIDGARYISQRDTVNTMAQRYRTTAVKALSLGLITIFILLVLRYRNLFTAFNTLLPALCAIIFIFGLWSMLKQPISFLHLIGALLAVAICVDYGIFYSENRSGNSLVTYQAMGASMLTTLAAFAALSISTNPLLQTLSVAVTLGVGIGFLLCPVLIKPVD
jgi:predicted exporter